ncbi:DUF169 domain-containing protein [uncultured Methanobrevibacter sp.]|uniref:DUF169 domain-containing protein n=1 Tax=uncultured Methanobrevibacter sp. TaxID=253161 RepID=UPI0026384102|nr:DUF169 domain-containing protein [uncultured Methanobrevibacter sp.]
MNSNITKEMNFRFPPIALIKTDTKPDDAVSPKPGKGGCVMAFVARTIAKRETTCFGRENITCGGISSGFGWGTGFKDEEALDFQATFLSCGVESAPDREEYEKKLEYFKKNTRKMFKEGERIFTDFKTAKENIKSRPIYDSEDYVVFKGMENLEEEETPESVIFTVNAVELTALIQINSSFRTRDSYVLTPQASACQAIGNFTFQQAESDDPKPILGPVDFAGKYKMKHFIPSEYLTLSMPWKLFLKLEEISEKSVLQTELWKKYKN